MQLRTGQVMAVRMLGLSSLTTCIGWGRGASSGVGGEQVFVCPLPVACHPGRPEGVHWEKSWR